MTLRPLGSSDLKITPIGLGTWAIGGSDWGPQDDADSIATIQRSVELGINWIDTAPVYGYGHSERIVGQVLADLDSDKRPYVFTKCGLVWDEAKEISHSLKADSVRKDVEASLERLKVDVLDLCQIHWPCLPWEDSDMDIEEGWSALSDLVEEGMVKHIGVSNFDVAQLRRIKAIAPVTSLQPPYSMLMRGADDEILEFCEQHDIGVIGYSPMHNGLLSGRMTRERIAALPPSDWRVNMNPAFKEPLLTQNLRLVELLRSIGDRHGRTAGEVAIAWTLRRSAVTGAIVGARNADQVDGFVGAMDFRLSEDELTEIGAELPESVTIMFERN